VPCGTSYTSANTHYTTAQHRARVAGGSDATVKGYVEAGERAAWARSQRLGSRAAEDAAHEAAVMAGDAEHEPYWLGVAIAAGVLLPPDPGDGTYVPEIVKNEVVSEPRMVVATIATPARKAERGHRPAPCHRCGRADFATDKGRAWHLEHNPSCAKRRQPERHTYTMIGG
jgi:hypothetical protein